MRRSFLTILLALSTLTLPHDAAAQWVSLGGMVGVAAPSGTLAERRMIGPDVSLSAHLLPTHRFSLRGDLEASWLPGREDFSELRLLSAQLYVVAGPRGRTHPYVLLGGGTYWASGAQENRRPHGVVPGIGVGLGITTKLRGIDIAAEARLQSVLSAYATGREYGTGTFWPIGIRVQF